jgi:magnesium chelatase subunit I
MSEPGRARPVFPFSAIVGQESLKEALLICAVDPSVGGVLILGDRGTGKSTAVRALAGLLPDIDVVDGCAYGCAYDAPAGVPGCESCDPSVRGELPSTRVAVPIVDLPLGASEDRITGALNIERAMTEGVQVFEPGLLARANRGFLYIDEVNLLEDHLVDLLLDAAASGENVVEREGLSVRHPAKFVLVGSGNPEEGELRPQMLDRFGLAVHVATPTDLDERVQIVRRRDEFDRDPDALVAQYAQADDQVRVRIEEARARVTGFEVPDAMLRQAAALCVAVGTDGLRGELTLIRAARAHAALQSATRIDENHLYHVAMLALRHRLRKDPLDETSADARISRAMTEVFGAPDD